MSSKEQTYSNDKVTSTPPVVAQELDEVAQQTHSPSPVQRAKLAPGLVSARDVSQLQQTIGNQAIGRLLRAPLQRQQAAPVSERDRREFVQDTIHFFNGSADFYRDEHATINPALFEQVINSWYFMVVDRERMIDADLGGDVLLKRELRDAYIAALRVLMSRAARAFSRNERDLYRENNGRIPIWAWQTPHHMEMGISTPIAEGRAADVITGEVEFRANSFEITIAPDGANPTLGSRAETRFDINKGSIQWHVHGGLITAFNGPGAPSVRIQTFYGPGVSSASSSGYGRGTTPQDIAVGRVHPRSTSVGFHEGNHGLDFVEFLENNPPPQFTGAVGMTMAAFQAARNQWQNDWNAYNRRLNEFSLRRTDCVGTTIDQYNDAHAGPGAHIVHECL